MGRYADSIRSYVLAPFTSTEWPRDRVLARLFGAPPTIPNVRVTPEAVLGLPTVRSCISLVSGAIASCVPYLYRRRNDGGREKFDSHPLHALLTREPNGFQTAVSLRETAAVSLLTYGACYLEITARDQGNRPQELVLLHPDSVQPHPVGGAVRYRIATGTGGTRDVSGEDVCAVLDGYALDAITPVSIVTRGRDVFALALALDQHAARFFANGAMPGGVLQHPGRLSPEAHERLRASFEAHYSGANAFRPAILEEGMAWLTTTTNGRDSQLLESRRWASEEICKLFNVPPTMVGVATQGSGLTYRNVEDEALRFLTFTLAPLLRRFESALAASLISSLERNTQYIEFDTAALLRADLRTRYDSYAIGIKGGWLSPDDIRQRENLPPLPNNQGQIYLSPSAAAGVGAGLSGNGQRSVVVKEVQYDAEHRIAGVVETLVSGPTATDRRVVREEVARLLRRQAEQARKAGKSPARLHEHVRTDYDGGSAERARWAATLEPVVALAVERSASGRAPREVTAAIVAAHFARSAGELRELFALTPEAFPRRLEETVTHWERATVEQLTEIILQGGPR